MKLCTKNEMKPKLVKTQTVVELSNLKLLCKLLRKPPISILEHNCVPEHCKVVETQRIMQKLLKLTCTATFMLQL